MSDVVIVGVLSLVGTLVGSVCGILAANKMTNYRIEQLEKRMDKHNTVIDRTYKLEQRAGVMDEQMKVANHRIDDLEREE
ncbi:MAG: hypothetical protein RSG96_06570 [Clostridia bacterium]